MDLLRKTYKSGLREEKNNHNKNVDRKWSREFGNRKSSLLAIEKASLRARARFSSEAVY